MSSPRGAERKGAAANGPALRGRYGRLPAQRLTGRKPMSVGGFALAHSDVLNPK